MSCAKLILSAILCLIQMLIPLNYILGQQGINRQIEDPKVVKESSEDPLIPVWNGVQEAQRRYRTGCGKITEVRASKLFLHPLIFRGSFCASGTQQFHMEYVEPESIRLVFNHQYLNVTTGREKKTTEIVDIGNAVVKTQRYFSAADSLKNLRSNFTIQIEELRDSYAMKLIPRSRQFKQKVNYVNIVLRKKDFLLKSLEIDGKSGVNSIFAIEMTGLNTAIEEDVFKVITP
jgi:hypothetical protein